MSLDRRCRERAGGGFPKPKTIVAATLGPRRESDSDSGLFWLCFSKTNVAGGHTGKQLMTGAALAGAGSDLGNVSGSGSTTLASASASAVAVVVVMID